MHAFRARYNCRLGTRRGNWTNTQNSSFSSPEIYAHKGVNIIALACIVFALASRVQHITASIKRSPQHEKVSRKIEPCELRLWLKPASVDFSPNLDAFSPNRHRQASAISVVRTALFCATLSRAAANA